MRPPHPAFNVRDDRETPLIERGTRTANIDFGKNESGMFFVGGLDRWNRVERVGEIGFSAQAIFGIRAPIVGVARIKPDLICPTRLGKYSINYSGLKACPPVYATPSRSTYHHAVRRHDATAHVFSRCR
jgi:hypothetical protein